VSLGVNAFDMSATPTEPPGSAPGPPPVGRGHFHWPTFAADAVLVTGGALAANAINYVYHFLLSRRLGPAGYGELATMLAISMVVGVVGSSIGTLAMQETAKLWAGHLDGAIVKFGRKIVSWSALVGLAVGVLVLALSPLLGRFFHIASPLTWTALAVLLVGGIVAAGTRGALQGGQRFALYAASLTSESAVKLALGFALTVAGFGSGGALAGAAGGILVGAAIATAPTFARSTATVDYRASRFARPGMHLTLIYAASMALFYVDLIFAKHALPPDQAGYYAAAGLLARIIPFGAGLVVPLVTPKAVAAMHANRATLARLLAITFGAAGLGICVALAVAELFPAALVALTYGAKFAQAPPLLRLYAVDTSLIAVGLLGYSYLAAIGEYAVVWWLVGAVVLEAACMAAWGTTPQRLLTVAIIGNAAVLPAIAALMFATLRQSPQAPRGGLAEKQLSTLPSSEFPNP